VETTGAGPGGAVNVQASESVTINGSNLQNQPSAMVSQTQGRGPAGTLTLTSPVVLLANGGIIGADTAGEGHGGKIVINANELKIIAGASIKSNSTATGQGGEVQINAAQLLIDEGRIWTIAFKQGDAGNIYLEVGRLMLTNGAQVNASTQNTGRGGEITIKVTDTADISGQTTVGPANPSGISSSAFGDGPGGSIHFSAQALNLDKRGTLQTLTKGNGNAGDIILTVKDLRITQGGDIDASNEGTGQGKGGNVNIHASGVVLITAESVKGELFGGIYSNANNAGAGGNLSIAVGQLTLREGGTISAESQGTGPAGSLSVCVDGPLTIENANLTTHASQAGGGNLQVETLARIDLRNSKITARAEGRKREDSGGNVTVHNQNFLILDNSQMLASAIGGDGGNIEITSKHFLSTPNSRLDASSELGVAGKVQINAPATDLTGSLIIFSGRYTEVATWVKKCKANQSEEDLQYVSHFVVKRLSGSPPVPGDLQSPLILLRPSVIHQ
jgi:large exoprotein involved in heme utilization and adhesion